MLTKDFIRVLICIFCLILILGCTILTGKRMADGTYLTIKGEAVGFYIGPYDLTLQSGLEIISSMEMPIRARRKVRNGIVIMSETLKGSPLRLQFTKEGRAITRVKIRTGRLGYWDNEFSYQLHALMKAQLERLNQKRAKLKRIKQQKPVQEPYRDKTPEVASSDVSTAASASKPSVIVQSPTLKPEAADFPNEETSEQQSAKTVATASGESLPIVKNVSELWFTEPNVSIFFNVDSNLPAEEELAKLDRIALQAFSNSNSKIALTGYIGEFDNMDQADLLSRSRVMAVKYYLIGKGVAADRLVMVPEELVKNDQVEGEVYRRVEIRIYTEP